jgi:hypothetical protein
MLRPAWYPDWGGQVAVIVGAGASATTEAVGLLRGRVRTIVVNTSYQLAPWADVLYACDLKWWDWHKGAPEFSGLKVAHETKAAERYGLNRVDLVQGEEAKSRLSMIPGALGRGGNSGYHAFNLALQFGARRIGLLGLDFCGRRWHGLHPNGREQAEDTLARWRATFDAAADQAKAIGADVVNLSGVSALTAYPKMTIDQAFDRWKVPHAVAA